MIPNIHLESLHYNIAMEERIETAVKLISSLSLNDLTAIGFDTTYHLVHRGENTQQLERLDEILASQAFSKLTRILVRLSYGPLTESEYTLSDAESAVYSVFRRARARGIVEVELLTYERRYDYTRDVADDDLLWTVSLPKADS
jgi:hypothetical protein